MSNILICYNSGFGGAKYEDFANEFYQNGHNVLLSQLDHKDSKYKAVSEQIASFNPNLAFSFNNVIPKTLLDKINCPVAVIDADTPLHPTFINRENLAHPNIYYFGCQSITDKIYDKIPNFTLDRKKYLYLSFTATNFKKNDGLEQDIPVSFLGSNGMFGHYKKTQNYKHEEVVILVKNNKSWDSNCSKFNEIKHTFNAQKRLKYLSQLTDLGLQIYGNDTWKDVFKHDIDLAKCYVEQEILDPQSAENLYNRSKISINIDHDQAETAFSFRVSDIMASNACILTSYKKDWEDLFGIYISQEVKEAIIYKNQYDMRQKCIALLNDEELRLRCVKECQNAIAQNGRWKHRLKRIEDFLDMKFLLKNNQMGQPNFGKIKIINNHKPNPQTVSEFRLKLRIKNMFYSAAIFIAQIPVFDLFIKEDLRSKLYKKLIKYQR